MVDLSVYGGLFAVALVAATLFPLQSEALLAGLLIASESLATGGVRVKKRDGHASLIDGPFAEAKEMIGGFYLLDCATKEEAIEIASACPAAEWCEVEVRKIGPCWE